MEEERNQLLELRDKVSKLNEKELKLRDEYLKKISSSEMLGPMTGYSSLDKPALKNYREEPIKDIKTDQTIYEMVFDQEDMKAEAIGYLGVNWTFEKLKTEVDKCANCFNDLGIKKDDTILIGVSNSPESVVALLALNKLGAVSKWFDLRASEKDIKEYANSSNCKYMIAFDMILPKIESVIDETNLKKVIVTSPVGPLSSVVKQAYKLKNMVKGEYRKIPNDKRFISYENLMKTPAKSNVEKCCEFDKNKPSIMIQSSGTTGKPKTIVHSDYSVTQCTREIAYSDVPLGKGKTVLVALPPWIAYGIGDAIVLPMSLGGKVELCPNFEPDSVFKNVGKFTAAFAAPFHYRYLKDNMHKLNPEQKKAFEKIECFISGGDKISIEENREFEEVFKTPLINGYGNNEGWGVLSVNPVKNNKYGTVGIPKYDEIITSFDPDTGMELPYGEAGEICSLANTQFLGYENNEEATNESKKQHTDGKTWLHTGDIGYVDNEGFIHLEGRARRVIVRLGFKISAYTIEDALTENPFVKECVAISVNDELEEHVPMVYIVLKDEVKDQAEHIEELLLEYCTLNLKEYEIPKYIRVVEQLPYTPNGKYDFRKLESMGNAFVEENKKSIKEIKNL